MNTESVLSITLNEKGQMYAMAQRRQLYVAYLQQHEHDSKIMQVIKMRFLNGPKQELLHLISLNNKL